MLCSGSGWSVFLHMGWHTRVLSSPLSEPALSPGIHSDERPGDDSPPSIHIITHCTSRRLICSWQGWSDSPDSATTCRLGWLHYFPASSSSSPVIWCNIIAQWSAEERMSGHLAGHFGRPSPCKFIPCPIIRESLHMEIIASTSCSWHESLSRKRSRVTGWKPMRQPLRNPYVAQRVILSSSRYNWITTCDCSSALFNTLFKQSQLPNAPLHRKVSVFGVRLVVLRLDASMRRVWWKVRENDIHAWWQVDRSHNCGNEVNDDKC